MLPSPLLLLPPCSLCSVHIPGSLLLEHFFLPLRNALPPKDIVASCPTAFKSLLNSHISMRLTLTHLISLILQIPLCLGRCFFPLVKMHKWTCLTTEADAHRIWAWKKAQNQRDLRQWEEFKVCIGSSPVKWWELWEQQGSQIYSGTFKNKGVSHSRVKCVLDIAAMQLYCLGVWLRQNQNAVGTAHRDEKCQWEPLERMLAFSQRMERWTKLLKKAV